MNSAEIPCVKPESIEEKSSKKLVTQLRVNQFPNS